jgi:2-polyprenyl-6-methoxyphenol hydroxylase-like FAD-dependent oxidoreductase
MRAIICGGGVGGISAGLALRRIGWDVTVYERSEELRVTGAGLNLWPNAGRALKSLGLGSEYERLSAKVDRFLTISSSGETLFDRSARDWDTKYGAPATGILRRELSMMLGEALGWDQVRFGHELVDFTDDGGAVTCTFANGESDSADLLVGADGIHSLTRQLLFGSIAYRPNQHHADRWRGLVRLADVDFDANAETEVFGDASFFGTLPISNDMGYWFASGPGMQSLDDFSSRFGAWTNTHVPKTIEATIDNHILRTELFDLSELPEQWSRGRVTLLGDAAHPMMPDMAQGASQTFVDSVALGHALESAKRVEEGLALYEERRRADVYRVVHLSRRGMFAGAGTDAERSRTVDPISLRYERDVEQRDVHS